MAIQQLDLTGALDAATPISTIAQAARAKQESDLRLTEGQLNIKKLQMAIDQATKDQAENDQIKARLAQGGDPNAVYQDLVKINPDKAAKYRQDQLAEAASKRAEAIQNLGIQQNQPGPMVSTPQAPVQVAAPQPMQAPIQTNLPGPGEAPQMSTPAAPPSIFSSVNLPNKFAPATSRQITIPSGVGGEPITTDVPYLEESQRRAQAAAQAAETFKTNEAIRAKQAEGVVIPEGGTLHREGQPDITGQPKQTEIEKEAEPWLKQNPGKTLADYVQQKSEFGQKLNAFNNDVVLTTKYGKGPNGLAKWEQDQAIDKSVRTAQAESAGKISVAKIEAQNRADISAAEDKAKKQAALNEPPPKVKEQVSNSNQSLDQIDTIRKLVAAKPYLIGPVAGRLDKYENAAGTSFGLKSPEDERDAQRLLANLGNLLVNENLVASPGRTNKELLAILKAQGASISQNGNFLEGSLRGAEDRAQQAIANGQRYGINVPRSTVGKITVTAPDGSVHPFDTQAQADAFKALIDQATKK